jgi:hypothetical protein
VESVAGGATKESTGSGCVLLADILGLRSTVENVELVLGQVLERIDRGAEVLGQDRARGTSKHLRDEESSILVKVTLVKDKQKLCTVLECLDRVRNTSREEPDISLAKIVSEGLGFVVDSCNTDTALENQGPFAGSVPVKLTVGVRLELHVDTSHVLGVREHSSVLLASPTGSARGSGAVVRQTKRPNSIGNGSRVCTRGRKQIRVQLLILKSARASICATKGTADGLRLIDALKVEIDTKAGVCILAGNLLEILHLGVSLAGIGDVGTAAALETGASVKTANGSSDSRNRRSDTSNSSGVLSIRLDPAARLVSCRL